MTSVGSIVVAASQVAAVDDLCLVSFTSLLGAFLGQCVGRALREPRERIQERAFEGGFVGFAIGFALWLAALPTSSL